MAADKTLLDQFLHFSSVLTGFGTYHLRGTGQAELYLSTLTDVVGADTVKVLLDSFSAVAQESGDDEAVFDREFRRRVLSDDKLGPVTRNLIKLWYVGSWYELPRDWRDTYGENENDRTFVVSSVSYTEGLLWPAIGGNPSGAKPLGYGVWATPPRFEQES